MGMLLRFSPKVPQSLPASSSGGPAEVILFTGVRYERDAAKAIRPARKPKRSRKG